MKLTISKILLSLVVVALLVACYLLTFTTVTEMAKFVAGVAVGVLLLVADPLWLVKYYQRPGESLYQDSLITRSLLFLVAVALAGLFIVTSSGSIIGAGIVLGMGWWYSLELLPFRVDLLALNQYLGQTQRPLSLVELQWVWRGVYVWSIVMSLNVLFSF